VNLQLLLTRDAMYYEKEAKYWPSPCEQVVRSEVSNGMVNPGLVRDAPALSVFR
jgi:hypothetical protein